MTLRPATAADERFLREMLGLAAGWRQGSRVAITAELEKYVHAFGRAGDHGLVALDGSAALGAAWYRQFSPDDRGYGYVSADVPELALAVEEHARRAGIATALMRRLLADAGEQGLPGVSLSVGRDNPARRLYERLGFVKVGDQADSWTMLRTFAR